MAGGLTIGGEGPPMPGDGGDMPAQSGSGELATEAFCKACASKDYAAAYEAFKDMLMSADDEIGPDSGGDEMAPDEPTFPPG